MVKKSFLAPFGALLVFAIVFSAFTPSFALFEGIETNDSLKETDRNFYYGLLYSKLMDSFPKVLIPTEYGEKEEVAYPPEYAGAYVDKSNTLHILLTKKANMATKNNYQEIMENDDDIIYDIVDFPLSRLYEIQNRLDVDAAEKFGISFTCLNETANRLDIGLFDRTKEKEFIEFLENKFNDFDPRCIVFNDPIEIKPTGTDAIDNALAGSTVHSTLVGTIGFNARKSLQFGMVTAGHVAPLGASTSNSFYMNAGTTSLSQFSGNLDASFVPFTLMINPSTEISGLPFPDDHITHYYPNDGTYPVTLSVRKRGAASGTTYGNVLSKNAQFYYQGVWFSGLAYVSNAQAEGDSGAPVFHTIPNTGGDYNVLLGIATFANTETGYAYVSKVENIISTFGITPLLYPT